MVKGHAEISSPGGGSLVKAVRRFGTNPVGRTPASLAIISHQAPAALTMTGAEKEPAGVSAIHTPPDLESADTSASVTTLPPRRRKPFR